MNRKSGVRSYRLVQWPWPVRAMILGLVIAAGGFVLGWMNDRDTNLLGELAGAVIAGLVSAVGLGLFLRSSERRLFDVDGRMATPDERLAVLRALDAGRWPADPRLHPVAGRLVEQRLRQTGKLPVQVAGFGLMIVVALVNVVLNGPWWWLAVAFWVLVSPWALLKTRRSRAAALALRESGPVPT